MEVHLKSKVLHSVKYDRESRYLVVVMRNGQRREFEDVPEYVIEDLQITKSPGSYYEKLIRYVYPLRS